MQEPGSRREVWSVIGGFQSFGPDTDYGYELRFQDEVTLLDQRCDGARELGLNFDSALSDAFEVWKADDLPTELASTEITLDQANNCIADLVCALAIPRTGKRNTALHLLNRGRMVGQAEHTLEPRGWFHLLDSLFALFNCLNGDINGLRASIGGGTRILRQKLLPERRIRENLATVLARIKRVEIAR